MKKKEEDAKLERDKNDLFAGNSFEIDGKENLMFLKQNDKLLQAKKDLYGTEYTAIDIKKELNEQSSRIESAVSRVKGIFGDLGQSNSMIGEMSRRVKRNKLVYYMVCLFMFAIIVTVMWFKFY